ncbi:MAG: hypothetical protein ACYCSF_04600 [Acidimicrobiales bacterium]
MFILSVFRLLRRLVGLVVLAAFTYLVVSSVQVLTSSRAPGAVGAGPNEPVIAVVASGQSGGGAPLSADFATRLSHAASLRSVGRAPRIIVLATSRAQALTATRFLESHGAPQASISSIIAPEVPEAFVQLRSADPSGRAIVVGDRLQTLWLSHVAGTAGLSVIASPVSPPHSGIMSEIGAVARQGAAVAWGRLAGFARTGFIAG